MRDFVIVYLEDVAVQPADLEDINLDAFSHISLLESAEMRKWKMLFLPALTRNAYMGLWLILLVPPAEGIRPGLYTTGGYVGCSKLGKYFAVHCIYLMLNESYGGLQQGHK